MTTASPQVPIESGDLLQAIAAAQVWFDRWLKEGRITAAQHRAITNYYTDWRARIEGGAAIPPNVHLRQPNLCWSCKELVGLASKACPECGAPVQGGDATALRYLLFLCLEIRKHQESGRLTLAAADDCLADANSRINALRSRLDRERIPLAEAAPPASGRLAATALPAPRRNLLEILLDPRSIQWLLGSGGALLVVGLLIWLAAMGIFENKLVVAGLLGAANAALLLGVWAVIRFTRHEMAGRALTLLACLVMPFNLWFYDRQGLITLSEGGHLWIPAVVCCILYALSARLLRDPTFVYVLVLGVAGTGLLILDDNQVEKFWEIAGPSTLLVALGFLSIQAERIFPEGEGPFTRRSFGLAFFWSGHVLLAAGLLLLLGAHVAGDWLYAGLFEPLYRAYGKGQPEIVTAAWGKLLALALVLVGTYLYAYSDLVVRRVGAYLYLAVLTLLWAEVLVIRLFPWPVPTVEVIILALALTGLAANLTLRGTAVRGSGLMRAGPPLALVLSTLPVVLGVILHFQATAAPEGMRYHLTWTYVAAMLTVAVSCRVGAFLYRHDSPSLAITYFFGTGAALLVGAAGLLLVLYPAYASWEFQAPILMLIPLLYLGAARLYRGHASERPVLWVAHAAMAVMLASSIGAAFQGFVLVADATLNLRLALFFAEAAVFYILEAFWRRQPHSIYATTVAASAAVWQLLKYNNVAEEYYILTFALVGLALLIAYRFAVMEKTGVAGLAGAAYQCGNALVSLAFVAGALLTLSELVQKTAQRGVLVSLLLALAAIALVAVALVRQEGWRRWYVAMAVTHAALTVLVLAVLSRLTLGERLEIVSVVAGLLLLVVGHLGWYREQEGQSDLVSVTLFFGSLLVALPLTIATVTCRAQLEFDTFHTVNEVGMLAAGLVLLAAGYICRIRSTTLAGAFLMAIYLVTLLLYVRLPEKLQNVAVYIMVGGGLFFGIGLLLSLYRDRLLQLPDRIKRREGVFRVLSWR